MNAEQAREISRSTREKVLNDILGYIDKNIRDATKRGLHRANVTPAIDVRGAAHFRGMDIIMKHYERCLRSAPVFRTAIRFRGELNADQNGTRTSVIWHRKDAREGR